MEVQSKAKWSGWMKKSGIVVFMLFLIKGLAWIAIALYVWIKLQW